MNPEVEEGYISVWGGKVWYRKIGKSGLIPLLLLHGGPGLASGYLESLEALAEDRPVIRYDQLGGGKSNYQDDVSLWTLERFTQEVGQVCNTLGLDQVHILGHSWGGMLAVSYALTKPPGLKSLILASPFISGPYYLTEVKRLLHQLPQDVQQTLHHHEMVGTTSSAAYQQAVLEFYRRHLCRQEWFIEIIAEEIRHGKPNPPVYEYMNGPSEFHMIGPIKDYDLSAHLGELSMPVLFTCGRYDEVTPESATWFHSLISGSEMVVFEQSAHMAHFEEKDRYLQVVRDFLNRVEAVP